MAAANGAPCPTPLQDAVEHFLPGGCYGIEWVLHGDALVHQSHFNPQWRVEGVRKQGLDGLYTTKSANYEFSIGQGWVGKAFASQEPHFVKDLSAIDPEGVKDAMQNWYGEEFMRASLAKQFGIRSALFLPSQSGVLEVGSAVVIDALPRYFASHAAAPGMPPLAAEGVAPEPEPAAEAAPPPPFLKRLVEECTVAGCYAIEWVLRDGTLVHQSHYNPQWRVEGVRKQGLNGLYTTESTTFTFEIGQGFVGKAFAAQQLLFVKDLQATEEEDIKDAISSWYGAEFLRAALAEKYGIRSALFLPSPAGVFEVGATSRAGSLEEFFTGSAKAAVSAGGSPGDILAGLKALA